MHVHQFKCAVLWMHAMMCNGFLTSTFDFTEVWPRIFMYISWLDFQKVGFFLQ